MKSPEENQHTTGSACVRRLVRLPNGAWVRPDSVIAVRALPTSTGVGSGNLHRARVTIKTSDGPIDVILANDDEHAQIMADELAGIFNGESNTEASHAR